MKHRKIIALAVSLTLVSCFFIVPVAARQSPADATQTNLDRNQPNILVTANGRKKLIMPDRRIRLIVAGSGQQLQPMLPAEALD